MTTRERFQAIMNFQPFDRLPILEWAVWWDKTIDRWHGEGLPVDLTDRYALNRHFGQDAYLQDWISIRKPDGPQPAAHGAGILTSLAEYEAIRPFLYPLPAIDQEQWRRWAEQQAQGDAVLWFTVEGFFWFARELMGIERHLYGFYDQADLIHRINADLAEWMLAAIDEICAICTPGFMTFAEDMSYNHGPMLSKKLFAEFMQPYYLKVIPRLKERGIIPIVDSDGDITLPASWFEDAGLEGILPLERLLPTAAQGGFLISCDHQTPPGVSYQEYQSYLALFHEYAGQAGRLSQKFSKS